MNLVFLGPPGSGKGTIATIAKEKLGFVHISTGQLFREEIKNETPLGKRIRDLIAQGELASDEDTIEILQKRLEKDDVKQGYILDGFPRTMAQAVALSEMEEIDYVVIFKLEKDEIIKRLSGRRICRSTGRTYHIIYNPPKVDGIDDDTGEALVQRSDDKEEAVLHRLDVYKDETAPLIEFYRKQNLIKELDAKESPEKVFQQLVKIIGYGL
ncbi:MAG: adenylate kinase [Sphaerochaetaceae bacterium]|jgi:adenylate kinase